MVFAYSELTQYVKVSKVGLVGDGVKVGLTVGVVVTVGVNVPVADGVSVG